MDKEQITQILQSKIFLVFIIIIALSALSQIPGIKGHFHLENIRKIFDGHLLLSSLLFITLFTLGNFLNIPGWIFLVAAVVALGQYNGYFLTLLGAIISTVVSYFVIRSIGKDSVRELEYQWVQKVLLKIDSHPLRTNIILRVIFQTAPPLNYALALTGVSFSSYFWGALIGLPIPIFIYTFFIEELSQLALSF